jgi:hypothetical protein
MSLSQLGSGRSLQVEAARTNEELDILEAKGGIVIVGVLPRPKKGKECQDDHIGGCLVERVTRRRQLRQSCHTSDDLDWDRLNTEGSWVGRFPGFDHTLEPEVNSVRGIKPGILGPHVKECLGNVPYVIFSRSSPDRTAAGR